MMESILVAVITGGIGLIGTIITVISTSRKSETNMRISQAVTENKIDELTREVRIHNDFAHRVPIVEEKIKVINHRLEDLEKGGAGK